MEQGNFGVFVAAETVCHFRRDPGFVVHTLDGAHRQLTAGSEPVEKQLAMSLERSPELDDRRGRHWVVSLPFQLRYLLGYHRTLCTQVMQAIAHELMRSYRRRAKRALGLPSIAQAHSGTVTFVQRFDSALRLCVHAHVLTLDGVYLQEDDGGLTFHPLPEPTLAEVHAVAERIARRIERILHKAGRFLDHDSQGGDSADHDEFADEEPVLASCYRAATTGRQLLGQDPGQPVLRLVGPPPTTATRPKAKLVAEVRGVNVVVLVQSGVDEVHGAARVQARERASRRRAQIMCMPSASSMAATGPSSSACVATSHDHPWPTTGSPSSRTADCA